MADAVDHDLPRSATHHDQHVELGIDVLADPLIGVEADQVGVEVAVVRQAPHRPTHASGTNLKIECRLHQ